jgi:hypothetical protein
VLTPVCAAGSPIRIRTPGGCRHRSLKSDVQQSVATVAGLVRGGGNEFAMALDMRFAPIGRSGQAQPETLMGIYPGGGDTQD